MLHTGSTALKTNAAIPPGTNAYLVEDSFVLPLAVDLLAVLPHTHYLGKKLQGFAELPDGSTKRLISIPDWDFNWQGDYRYAHPVHLPRGTTLRMQYWYDNSAANPRNPNQPPKEVRYGPQSTDEMGELWFQVRLQNTNEFSLLAEACNEHQSQTFESYARFRLQRNPHEAQAMPQKRASPRLSSSIPPMTWHVLPCRKFDAPAKIRPPRSNCRTRR